MQSRSQDVKATSRNMHSVPRVWVLRCSPVGWWWWRLHRCQRRWDTARWTNARQMFLEACLRSDNPILPSPHPSETVLSCLNISKKTENVTMHHKKDVTELNSISICLYRPFHNTLFQSSFVWNENIMLQKSALQSYRIWDAISVKITTALPLKMTLTSKSFFLYTCVLMLDVHHNETWSNMFVCQNGLYN